ncbi:unnamed protein product [Pylaiella littoralis]
MPCEAALRREQRGRCGTGQPGGAEGKKTGFRLKDVSEAQMKKGAGGSTRLNPYRSISRVLCGGTKLDCITPCNKKLGGVKCYPPRSEKRLVFFQHTALLVNGAQPKSWEAVRNDITTTTATSAAAAAAADNNSTSISSRGGNGQGGDSEAAAAAAAAASATPLFIIPLMAASKEDRARRFEPKKRPPLVRSVVFAPGAVHTAGGGRDKVGGAAAAAAAEWRAMTKTHPRPYQAKLSRAVIECERNSLTYLPPGTALGRTLVAASVMQRLLELNSDRQAFFLVETDARAMQQAAKLRKELHAAISLDVMMGVSVGMQQLSRSGGGGGSGGEGGAGGDVGDDERKMHQTKAALRVRSRLASLRKARVVVATACAFEHAICQRYLDPASICCVVMDEAHPCDRGHPLFRISMSPYLVPNCGAMSVMSARRRKRKDDQTGSFGCFNPRTAAEFPKVLALVSSRAGRGTMSDTVRRVTELMGRLRADLVAPEDTLKEAKERTPRVPVELVCVPTTASESLLLAYLEKIILRRVTDLAPGSDAAIKALELRAVVDARERRAGVVQATAGEGAAAVTDDDHDDGRDEEHRSSWSQFPSQAYRALCEQALAGNTEKRALKGEEPPTGCSEMPAKGEGDGLHLISLMDLAFAEEEGAAAAAKGWNEHEALDVGRELDDAAHVLKSFFPAHSFMASDDDWDDSSSSGDWAWNGRRGASGGRAGAAPAGEGWAGGENALAGSKLEKVVQLLQEQNERCELKGRDKNGRRRAGPPLRFSALVLVSTRESARAAPDILENAVAAASAVRTAAAAAAPPATTLAVSPSSCSSLSILPSSETIASIPAAAAAAAVVAAGVAAGATKNVKPPSPSSFVKAVCVVGTPDMDPADQVDALEAFETGAANVLVSTPEYYEGGGVQQVPAGALVVVCHSPSASPATGSGSTSKETTAAAEDDDQLAGLRGCIRCEGRYRFVGLTRTDQTDVLQNSDDQEEEAEENEQEEGRMVTGMDAATHLRGTNMLRAIEHLKAGVASTSSAAVSGDDGDVSAMCGRGSSNGSSFASTSTMTSTNTSAGIGTSTGRSTGEITSSPVTSLGSRCP